MLVRRHWFSSTETRPCIMRKQIHLHLPGPQISMKSWAWSTPSFLTRQAPSKAPTLPAAHAHPSTSQQTSKIGKILHGIACSGTTGCSSLDVNPDDDALWRDAENSIGPAGTLTRNVMEFFKCSIAGVSYGTGVTEIERVAAARRSQVRTASP